jgi:hypothetical protein
MAVFFKILCEQHYPGTQLKLELLNRVVDYFMDNLQDTIWQNSISNKLCKEESNHNALLIVLRLFYESEIVEGNLKSYARYIKQKERLVIDQMLILDNFLKLSEDEMTPHGQALEEWTKNLDWETEAKPLWQKTSKDFAGSTVGEAHVFIYEPKYRGANSVWEQDELPILKKKGIPVFEHRIDADGNIKVKQILH